MAYEYQIKVLRDRLFEYKDKLAEAIDANDQTEIRHWERLIEEVENEIEGYENA